MDLMCRLLPLLFLLFLSESKAQITAVPDQDGPESGFFKKENLFTGGSLTFSILNNGLAFGINPHLGYSFTTWLDLALSMNFNHIGQRDVQFAGDKLRQVTYAPGAFIRIFPVHFLFLQAQYEKSWIRQRYVYPSGNSIPDEIIRLDAGSLLLGAGYSGNRRPGSNSYFYFTVLYDVLENRNSPYVNSGGRAFPIFRAGVNIALFQRR